MRKLAIIFLLMGFMLSNAQEELNAYKYVVVPNQFEFLKGKDTYQLNSLTKFLFNRKGFEAYLAEDVLPEDLFDDRCLALYAEVVEDKGGFRLLKLKVQIRDCKRNLLFESRVGISGENNHEKAHQLALRDAFVTIDELNYEYNETAQVQSASENTASTTTIKEEASTLNEVSEKEIAAVAVVAPNAESPKNLNLTRNDYESDSILTLKAMDHGFDVIDLNDDLYMTLLKTAAEDVYMVKGMDAIVFKKAGEWIMSTNDGNVASSKTLNIKN